MPDVPADSILNTIKNLLGIESDYTVYDTDITIHINSVFATLQQLGIGPEEGFEITDNTVGWTVFLLSKKWLNNVKSYMYLRVRLLFDPPATSFAIDAFDKQIKELEWRLSLFSPPAIYIPEGPPAEPGFANFQGVWNLTGLEDFPIGAKVGDIGVDYVSGAVWRKS